MDREYNRLRETSLGEDLYSYLLHRNRLPQVNRVPYMERGTSGEYNRDKNLITLLNRANGGTLTHEMAHAADMALLKQYDDRNMKWSVPTEPTQFTEGYDKLRGSNGATGFTPMREELAKKKAPAWFKDRREYRASNNELAGWGAGRQADSDNPYNVPDHLDSTMATELSILMDLAKREKPQVKQKPFSLLDLLFGK